MSKSQALLAFILLLVYFALHSVLAADAVKTWLSNRLGRSYRFYRLLYNLLAAVLLGGLLYWMGQWPEYALFGTNAWTMFAAGLLLATGAWIGLGSLLQYDLSEFTGLQAFQAKDTSPNHSQLNTKGFNALVRHPLYLGLLLLLLGWFLIFPGLSVLVLLGSVLVYLPFGIYFEELKLKRQFGQAYLDYAKRVKCLIPGLW